MSLYSQIPIKIHFVAECFLGFYNKLKKIIAYPSVWGHGCFPSLAGGFAFLWTTQASKTLVSRSLDYKISLKTINGKHDLKKKISCFL